MKVSLLIDADCTGTTPIERYPAIIEEARLADELGFYSWGVPEQHFAAPRMTTSAPDFFLASVAQATENLRIRFSSITLNPYNHPIQCVERLAVLDNFSKGRAELSTARGNARDTMLSYGIDPEQTRDVWNDSIRAIGKILGGDSFEYDGEFWHIPESHNLSPELVQKPHPPIYQVASSPESCQSAGEKGLGGLFLDNYLGWEYIQGSIDAYRKGQEDQDPVAPGVTSHIGFYCPSALCAPTHEEAVREGAIQAVPWFQSIVGMYRPFYNDRSYKYFSQIEAMQKYHEDVGWMAEHTPSVLIGTPDEIAERLKKLEGLGVEEVMLRVDGWDHETHMRTIELIGKHVIPELVDDRGPVQAKPAAAVN